MKQKRLCILMLLLSAVGVSAALLRPVADNLSFERGEVSWGTWGEGDLRQEYHGLSAQDGDTFLRLWKQSGWYQNFPTREGNRYDVTAYVAAAEADGLWGDAFGELKIEWRNRTTDEDDIEVGQATSIKFDCDGKQDRKIKKDGWVRLSLPTVQAPPGATHGRILCTIWTEGGDKGGGCALFDGIHVSLAP